ncbi:phosphate propanoyltransferase [Endozoicomonas sp. GU-1]|uniref:phosphate propanoyltransferase n=1 Tax=Endozoicomonas sp. GU-1 TaxID=3009078 RepID=UPI0022B361F4|nr:phosphate propanoyltransferase [Endozoicomonas sp. GU-1]WBA81388.1 phosphate propanoyltransferase [Endozoicomonas sp. GU-1]WBA84336.1 phosphate propanoyltransferase [Endozoicomonas sp. GU-1]
MNTLVNEELLKQIVDQVIVECAAQTLSSAEAECGKKEIPIEASARHVHLCQKDVEALFGAGHQLTPVRELSQPGQFLCEERVTVIGPKGTFEKVAVLGPARPESQVEISRTDARQLGVNAPLKESGDIAGSPGIFLYSSADNKQGMVQLHKGVIIARNHIHMTTADALRLGVKDKQEVDVRVETDRPMTFHRVLVRVNDSFSLAMHIDFDEANAVGLSANAKGELIAG